MTGAGSLVRLGAVAGLSGRIWYTIKCLFFFFQAEDGIRDYKVTGVQTCALPISFKHYSRALQLDPRHRGAHEYLGEAYLMIGNLAKAEEHLGALRRICLLPCAEYGDLEKKLAEYRKASVIRP